MKTLYDIVFKNKRVLLRVDYNVPLKNSIVSDNRKIKATIPTLQYICKEGAQNIVIISHLGRPKGKVDKKMSLLPVLHELQKLLPEKKIIFCDDCIGEETNKTLLSSKNGEIILLENLRFYNEETVDVSKLKENSLEKNKLIDFQKKLSSYGDVFVSDAFGCLHRAHSSISSINIKERVCGFLVQKEIECLKPIYQSDEKIDLVIIGGAKISDKILLIENLCKKTKSLIICGGMCFTFLKILGKMEIGNSIFDDEGAKHIEKIMKKAFENNVQIYFPIDFISAEKCTEEILTKTVDLNEGISKNWSGFDIGPKSIKKFKEIILNSKTIFWNGPAGVFEIKIFENGTKSILDAMIEATEKGFKTIIGGGETASCITKWKVAEKLTHVSTGGGATLELLEGKNLPGISFLNKE